MDQDSDWTGAKDGGNKGEGVKLRPLEKPNSHGDRRVETKVGMCYGTDSGSWEGGFKQD